MSNAQNFRAPVLLLTYRKSDSLLKIFNQLSIYNPYKLYIFQNPEKNLDEILLINNVKNIIDNFKPPFEVEFCKHTKHLPISESITTAIDYVFTKEKYLIILEDDIIPTLSFFHFCNIMLHKYNHSSIIGAVGGCNLNAISNPEIYFYSGVSIPYWGWATWKSKWQLFRSDNFYWNNFKNYILSHISLKNRAFFENIFEGNSQNVNVWDIQWNLSMLANDLKTVIPGANLVFNNGFSSFATSTNYSKSDFNDLPIYSIPSFDLLLDSNVINQEVYESTTIKLIQEIISNNIDLPGSLRY